MTPEQLMANIAKNSRALCTPEVMNRKASGVPQSMNYDADAWDSLYLSEASTSSAPSTPQTSTPLNVSNTRMPKAIVESIKAEPLDIANPLDKIDTSKFNIPKPAAPTTPAVSSNTGVDYGIIRAIINDCLEEKLKSLTSGALSEIVLKGGKIKLTDNKGNVYSARLEKEN